MPLRTARFTCLVVGLLALIATPLDAQSGPKSSAKAAPVVPELSGLWSGTATVPLPDSTIVVPVFYTFTKTGTTIGGTAMVPGQGSGIISHVTRDGMRLQFRVTAAEGRMLEHDGRFGADGAIEGMVNLDNQPIAKFRIMPKPPAKPAK